jgi:hypothetical protein
LALRFGLIALGQRRGGDFPVLGTPRRVRAGALSPLTALQNDPPNARFGSRQQFVLVRLGKLLNIVIGVRAISMPIFAGITPRGDVGVGVTPILEGADFAHQLERAGVEASHVLEQGGTAAKTRRSLTASQPVNHLQK